MPTSFASRLRCARPASAMLLWLAAAACAAATPYTAESYKQAVAPCMRARDYDCAQKNWEYYLRHRPADGHALANLGIVMNMRDNHAGAVAQFERAIELGEGTYDLFAYYADSLGHLGRIEEAIDWSYKALAVVPRLVDVRGKLAKLLVRQKRHYEALSVLGAFDEEMTASGKAPYFEGQRISIESTLARTSGSAAAQSGAAALRLARFGDHYYAPVTLGNERPATFIVDTGASRLTLADEFLERSKVAYKVIGNAVPAKLADGRKVTGRMVTIASLRVGPHEVKDIQAFACKSCVALLGQSVLGRFDMKSAKVQGVEFLTLTARR